MNCQNKWYVYYIEDGKAPGYYYHTADSVGAPGSQLKFQTKDEAVAHMIVRKLNGGV